MTFGAVSGGHFNPAVTIAAAAMRRIDPLDAVVYILAQLSGGVLGALLVKGLLLDEGRTANYGAVTVSPLLGGNFQGAIVEAIGAFLLVLAMCAVAFNPRARQEWAPLAIGTTLGFEVMVFGPLTGGSFNPARWFGPALIGDEFGGVWPYLLGPIVGALLAAALVPLRDRGPAVRARGGAPDVRRPGGRPGRQGRGDAGAVRLATPVQTSACGRPRGGRSHSVAWALNAPHHLFAQLHALALADVPVLLQVLRLRHPPGTPLHARRGRAAPRGGRPAKRQGTAGPDGGAAGGQPGGRRAASLLRPRGLRRLRRLGLRAGPGARSAAPHQPRGALAPRPCPPARGNRLPGADAGVGLGAPDGNGPRRLADQAPRPAVGDDRRRRRAAHPLHQRHPGRDRRDRGRAHRLAGGDRRLPPPPRPHPGGHPPELRGASEVLRPRGGGDRGRRSKATLVRRN